MGRRKGLRVLVGMASLVVEAGAVFLFLEGNFPAAALLHATASMLPGIPAPAMFAFYSSLSFFVPVLGPVGVFFLSLYSRGRRARLSPWHTVEERALPASGAASSPVEAGRYLAFYRDIEPAVDILKSEDARMKRKSIERLASERTPVSIRLLKEATRDTDGSVRLFASTALIQIEQELNEQVQTLREESEKEGSGTAVLADLALAYYQFCYLGLLDEVSSRYYAELAAAACRKSLEPDPEQYDVWVLLGRILLENRDLAGAQSCFSKAVSIEPEKPKAYGWWAETLFLLGRRAELIRCCRRLAELGTEQDRLKEAISWWAEAEGEAA